MMQDMIFEAPILFSSIVYQFNNFMPRFTLNYARDSLCGIETIIQLQYNFFGQLILDIWIGSEEDSSSDLIATKIKDVDGECS